LDYAGKGRGAAVAGPKHKKGFLRQGPPGYTYADTSVSGGNREKRYATGGRKKKRKKKKTRNLVRVFNAHEERRERILLMGQGKRTQKDKTITGV